MKLFQDLRYTFQLRFSTFLHGTKTIELVCYDSIGFCSLQFYVYWKGFLLVIGLQLLWTCLSVQTLNSKSSWSVELFVAFSSGYA